MRILLTGATGFIGKHILDSLYKEHEMTVIIRDIKNKFFYDEKGIRVVLGDLTDPEIYKKVPADIDLICHAAGILGKWEINPGIYYEVNVKGTDNLLNACLNRKIKRIIHISSAGVLGSSDRAMLNEQSVYNPKSIYEATKAEAEKHVLKFSQDNNIYLAILRPEFVYGEGNFHILGLFKAIKEQKFFLIGDGNALLHPTYIGDLAQALNLIINSEKSSGIYMVAGERFLTVREFSGIIAKMLNVAPPKSVVPYPIAKIAALLSELIARIFNFKPIFTRARLDFFTTNKACSIKLAISDLGYKPIKLEQGLINTINWYKNNGCL